MFSYICTSINSCKTKLHGGVIPGNNCHEKKRAISLIFSLFLSLILYFYCITDYTGSEMEVSLLLLSLGLILVGSSGNKTKTIKKEFSEEEMQGDLADSYQEKQTIKVFMNSTLSATNMPSFSMSKDVVSLTFRRLHYSFPKGSSPGDNKENYNDMVIWRKVSQANESCRLSNNFVLGFLEVTGGIPKASSCKCGQDLGIGCSESPELETTMGQLTIGKPFPRCQYHSVSSLKKILAVLTSNSLMSWLVSGFKL